MATIDIDEATHDRLRLVASALDLTEAEAIAHLLNRLTQNRREEHQQATTGPVAIHTVYRGRRVDAEFDRATEAVTITSGPLAGGTYDKPSPAARAVVGSIAPDVNPHRNGWSFWTVTATGEPVQTLRKGRP